MALYKLLKETIYNSSGNKETIQTGVRKDLGGGSSVLIPFSEGNTDYAEYLEWAKTNTAEAAD
tara:strand:+ start:412 stop:600 length:189 start_codon:yes stop_codon:yes gene_type:complete